MVVTIHSAEGSAPCRTVLLTAKAIGAPIVIKEVNVFGGANKTPEYLKLNPQHTIPTMEDNGLVIPESRAIMEYLVDAYATTDSLYPKNSKKRAVVSARLYFDATTLYPRTMLAILAPLFRGTEKTEANLNSMIESLEILDTLIGDTSLYLACGQLTIADISAAVTISNIAECGYDLTPHKNVARWFENAKKVIPGYQEINQKAFEMIKQLVQTKAAAGK